jgi:hypothetical protein
MHRFPRFFAVAILPLAALALVGCSGTDTGSSDPSASSSGPGADDAPTTAHAASSVVSASGGVGICHWRPRPGAFCPRTLVPGNDCRPGGRTWHWEKICTSGGPPTAGGGSGTGSASDVEEPGTEAPEQAEELEGVHAQ